MTIISNPVTGPVIGQPISPNFGVQFSGAPPANPVTPLQSGVPLLVQASNGSVPINQLVNTINGVSAGGDPSKGGDPCTISQILSNGNGAETARGASVLPNGANNQQVFVGGIATAQSSLVTGPTAADTSNLTECPVSAATLCQNVALFPQYGG